jgi:hypothetical protein
VWHTQKIAQNSKVNATADCSGPEDKVKTKIIFCKKSTGKAFKIF